MLSITGQYLHTELLEHFETFLGIFPRNDVSMPKLINNPGKRRPLIHSDHHGLLTFSPFAKNNPVCFAIGFFLQGIHRPKKIACSIVCRGNVSHLSCPDQQVQVNPMQLPVKNDNRRRWTWKSL
jgi:hypothetical protein